MFQMAQKAVEEFNRRFNFPIAISPAKLSKSRIALRAKWMKEEIEELQKADEFVDQVDAVADIIYFALGTFVEMGVEGSAVFQIVHESNMAKLPNTGPPLYDREGKLEKPRGWRPPKDQIRRFLKAGL